MIKLLCWLGWAFAGYLLVSVVGIMLGAYPSSAVCIEAGNCPEHGGWFLTGHLTDSLIGALIGLSPLHRGYLLGVEHGWWPAIETVIERGHL